jgi:hypothetical protein
MAPIPAPIGDRVVATIVGTNVQRCCSIARAQPPHAYANDDEGKQCYSHVSSQSRYPKHGKRRCGSGAEAILVTSKRRLSATGSRRDKVLAAGSSRGRSSKRFARLFSCRDDTVEHARALLQDDPLTAAEVT